MKSLWMSEPLVILLPALKTPWLSSRSSSVHKNPARRKLQENEWVIFSPSSYLYQQRLLTIYLYTCEIIVPLCTVCLWFYEILNFLGIYKQRAKFDKRSCLTNIVYIQGECSELEGRVIIYFYHLYNRLQQNKADVVVVCRVLSTRPLRTYSPNKAHRQQQTRRLSVVTRSQKLY